MLASDTITELARQRHANALLAGDNERLAREARLHTSAQEAAAPARARRSFLIGWWRHNHGHLQANEVPPGLAK